MRVNQSRRQLCFKIVYYGPGLSGKTTNLVQLHQAYPAHQRGDLIQLDTETERTLFFDYFPLSMGSIGGFQTKVDFFTVPGQSFYHATRRAVLEGADGIVFVADSRPDREQANLVAHQDLVQSLASSGRALDGLPVVYQWNKRDVPRALPLRALERTLNPGGAPSLCATAAQGLGVWETQGTILKAVFESVRDHAGTAPVPRTQTHAQNTGAVPGRT